MLDAELEINALAATLDPPVRHASGANDVAGLPEDTAAEAEHHRLLRTVSAEALKDLERVKDAIATFIGAPEDRTPIADVIAQLNCIMGVTSMARVAVAPGLLASISAYVSTRLLAGPGLPDNDELAMLADAIASVEYLLESVGKAGAPTYALLEQACASAARLGFPLDVHEADDAPLAPASAPGWTGINSACAALAIGATDSTPPPTPAGVPDESLGAALERPPVEKPVDAAASVEPKSSAVPARNAPALVPLTGEADDEILEIFIEEAQEQLETISALLPKWRAQSTDRASLSTLRRSFHTLKGSGRLVGALLLGEFAGSFETLLARVIEGEAPAAVHVHQILEQAADALAELVAQIRDQAPLRMDVIALMDTAHTMSEPGYQPAGAMPQENIPVTGDAIAQPGRSASDVAAAGASLVDMPEALASQHADIEGKAPVPDHVRESDADLPLPEIVLDDDTFALSDARGDIEQSLDSFWVDAYPAEIAQADRPPLFDAPSNTVLPAAPLVGIGRDMPADALLLDIFLNEARQHVATLEAGLCADTAAHPDLLPVTEVWLRALHTLNGSSLTARVPKIAPLCAPLERYVTLRRRGFAHTRARHRAF